jgi:SAM-dependent methyltransferase
MNQCPPALTQPRSRSNAPAGRASAEQTSRAELTFRGNLASTRHAWLRLTPAYSVRLVSGLLKASSALDPPFLDPFCGTGTTLLACTEHALDCDTVDINPFLIWLARSKVGSYGGAQLAEAEQGIARMRRAALRESGRAAWAPPIHRIERWWGPATLAALSRSYAILDQLSQSCSRAATNLLKLAFCQVLIERSKAHFGHQSMSFAPGSAGGAGEPVPEPPGAAADVANSLGQALERLVSSARAGVPATRRRLFLADARRLDEKLPAAHYGCVITSPPYANRMSYIRELRPYMYWLRYLQDRTRAGLLDWRAIGGTWGVATSNLGSWSPEPGAPALGTDLEARLSGIAERSPVLSSYVRKYFHDMSAHLGSLQRVLRPGGRALFVVGNSKFYDVVVPVEQVLARQFEEAGFSDVSIETLRKRSSKKELYEFLVSARRR